MEFLSSCNINILFVFFASFHRNLSFIVLQFYSNSFINVTPIEKLRFSACHSTENLEWSSVDCWEPVRLFLSSVLDVRFSASYFPLVVLYLPQLRNINTRSRTHKYKFSVNARRKCEGIQTYSALEFSYVFLHDLNPASNLTDVTDISTGSCLTFSTSLV